MLLVALPFAPLLLALAMHVPPDDVEVLQLTGDWDLYEGDLPVGHAVAKTSPPDGATWATLSLPGGYSARGHKSPVFWLRRQVTLPPSLQGKDLAFTLGTVRDAFVDIYVGDVRIGEKGVRTQDFRQEQAGFDSWRIPKGQASSTLTLTMRFQYHQLGFDGVADGRLLLASADDLLPWVQKHNAVKRGLEFGGLGALAFAFGMVLLLLFVDVASTSSRNVYISALLIIFAMQWYLLGKTGFVLSSFLSPHHINDVIGHAVTFIGWATVEFVESYFLGRTSKFGKVHRVVVGVYFVATLVLSVGQLYSYFARYLFGVLAYAVALSVRSVVRRDRTYGVVFAVALGLMIGAGANDLLTDIHIIATPRLFTYGCANMGIIAGVIVVLDFLRLAQRNVELTSDLAEKNTRLGQALQDAEESSRLKSEFLANTSHELRTPLNAIINVPLGLLDEFVQRDVIECDACGATFESEHTEAQVAQMACPDCGHQPLAQQQRVFFEGDGQETVRYLNSVASSGRHLLHVVNDILDVSKLEAGRMTLHLEDVDMVTLVQELDGNMRPLAEQKGLHLSTHVNLVDGADTLQVQCDQVKLLQVMVNLVSNALKFSPQGGEVAVRVHDDGAKVRIDVVDEGIGIAPEDQDVIFESFRQVEGGHTRSYGGTGLGLAITKGIVEMHGGFIDVHSVVGEGSTFTITLPKEARAQDVDEHGHAQGGIFVIDDEPTALSLTKLALKDLGLPVSGVIDPKVGLERMRQHRPALLILDVMLPHQSGIEVLREMADDDRLAGVPVLVASAYPDNRALAEQEGAAWVSKPWDADELLQQVRRLLDDNADREPASGGEG